MPRAGNAHDLDVVRALLIIDEEAFRHDRVLLAPDQHLLDAERQHFSR
jgi:hypothetical protein